MFFVEREAYVRHVATFPLSTLGVSLYSAENRCQTTYNRLICLELKHAEMSYLATVGAAPGMLQACLSDCIDMIILAIIASWVPSSGRQPRKKFYGHFESNRRVFGYDSNFWFEAPQI